MPKISYKFGIPSEKYSDFKSDVSSTAQGLELEHLIEFDDEKKSAHFYFDADIIEMFFARKLDQKKYEFFCCNPARYQNCQRFEDGRELSFADARQQELALYQSLQSHDSLGYIKNADLAKSCAQNHVIVGEYHPDPFPKTRLLKMISHWSQDKKKPVIAIERLPSSLNDELAKWLLDQQAQELPTVIKEYCKFIDEQNSKAGWSEIDGRDRELMKNSVEQILHAAKANHFDVMFFESEHSRVSCGAQANRHECLVTSALHLTKENPHKNFLFLAGAYHDDAQLEKVTLSKALGANSCLMMSPELVRVFGDEAKKWHDRGRKEEGDLFAKMAQNLEKHLGEIEGSWVGRSGAASPRGDVVRS